MDCLYLIIAIAVVGVLTLAGLLTSGRRRKGAPPSGGTDVIAPPPTEGDTITEAPPEPVVEPGVEAPPLEKPEGTASRLVRLRQRLSRSQGGLGKGLLALHCAAAMFTEAARYIPIVGGEFSTHGTGEFSAEIVAKDHPIVRGLAPFTT